ncbi:hypothetical protein AB0D49_20140 [Streptomyces sp. NPDC048290]|uniref:hypothetical protein n=1 Tax=Streptomyces sp. NPDC048290 TaxID=3155811 RepID=UPI00341F88C1
MSRSARAGLAGGDPPTLPVARHLLAERLDVPLRLLPAARAQSAALIRRGAAGHDLSPLARAYDRHTPLGAPHSPPG